MDGIARHHLPCFLGFTASGVSSTLRVAAQYTSSFMGIFKAPGCFINIQVC